jgi:MFS family permease
MVLPGVPTIQKDFATTSSLASWITSAFLITGSAFSPLFGKLGDSFGKKRMLLIALAFYTLGVGMAGFSPSMYFLLAARAIQGIGFAIVPLALAIIVDILPRERVATAQGIISGTFAIGAAAGLVIGAYVIQDFGWQWAFHSAFALSVILFAVVARLIKRDTALTKRAVDYIGAVILMIGVTALLYYLTRGPYDGWFVLDQLVTLALGVIASVAFFIFERGKTDPLIRLSMLRIRNVLIANLVGIISGTGMFTLFFAVVYFSQLPPPFGLGLSIISAGLTLAPATLVMLVVGPVVGRSTSRLGPRPTLAVGALVAISGLLLFAYNRSTTLDVTLDTIVAFVGTISIIIPIVNMISISVPPESRAVGLGMNVMLRNLGGALGPVLATTIMSSYTAPLIAMVGGKPVTVAQLPSSTAFDIIFLVGVAMMVLALVVGAATRNYTFRPRATAEQAGADWHS